MAALADELPPAVERVRSVAAAFDSDRPLRPRRPLYREALAGELDPAAPPPRDDPASRSPLRNLRVRPRRASRCWRQSATAARTGWTTPCARSSRWPTRTSVVQRGGPGARGRGARGASAARASARPRTMRAAPPETRVPSNVQVRRSGCAWQCSERVTEGSLRRSTSPSTAMRCRCTRRRSSATTWSRWTRPAASPRAAICEGFAPIRYAGHDAARGHGRCRARGARGSGVQHRAAGRHGRAPPDRGHGRPGLPRVVRRRDRVQACGRARARRRAHTSSARPSTLPYAVRVTEPGVVNVFLKLTTGGVPRGAAACGDGPAVRPRQGRLAGRREGRQRLPDHPAERQPGDPSGGHAAQRGPARANRRRLPVLRGGRDRERRAADRGGRQGAAGDRRRAGGHDPVRAGPRGQAGIHARGELLDRVQHRAPASWGSRRRASSTTAT